MKKILLFLVIVSKISLAYPTLDECSCSANWVFDEETLGSISVGWVSKTYYVPNYYASCASGQRYQTSYNEVVETSLTDSNAVKIQSHSSMYRCQTCPTDTTYNETTKSCDISCDENQTLDTSTTPPQCVDIQPPLDCPANYQPDANNTTCICNSPYIEDIATLSCILPPDIPDENSTNPNGDCELGFAKNEFGVCKQDSDGDNVPDEEDAYPNDPTKSGGESEDGGGFCKKNVNDCTPNCVCPAGTYDLVGFTSICFDIENGTTRPGKYCGVDGEGEEPTEPPPCNYPTPEYFGFKFQTVTSDIFKCVDLQFRYAGGAGENYNCPDTSVACYYNRLSDNNNTENFIPSLPDTNETTGTSDLNITTPPTESNSTESSDTKNIEDKLDAIKQSIENNNNHSDLISISDSIQGASDINHYDITKLNSDLGSKLDNINNSIQNIPQSQPTDMTVTNQKLQELIDKTEEGEGTEGDSSTNEMLNGASNSVSSLSSSLSSIISSATGTAPVVIGTGTSTFNSNIWGGNVSFDLSMFADMKQYFDILWLLLLAFINFKIYSIIIRDLLKKL